jgi:hypothetical protein
LQSVLPQPETTASYCVGAGTLRFDAGIDAIMSGASKLTFRPVDCTDGQAGLFETKADCGMACPNSCN